MESSHTCSMRINSEPLCRALDRYTHAYNVNTKSYTGPSHLRQRPCFPVLTVLTALDEGKAPPLPLGCGH